MDITLTGRYRHAALWRARNKLGSARAMADQLGVHQSLLGLWINLKGVPGPERMADPVFQKKILDLTGELCEALFPPDLKAAIKGKELTVEITAGVDLSRLIAENQNIALPPSQEEALITAERNEIIDSNLKSLSEKEEYVIRRRFGIGGAEEGTLEEVGRSMCLSRERVKQIECHALKKLKHPLRSQALRGYADIREHHPVLEPDPDRTRRGPWDQYYCHWCQHVAHKTVFKSGDKLKCPRCAVQDTFKEARLTHSSDPLPG